MTAAESHESAAGASGGVASTLRLGLGWLAAAALAVSAGALLLAALASRTWWVAELFTHFRQLHLVLTVLVSGVLVLVGWRWVGITGLGVAVVLAVPMIPYWFGGGEAGIGTDGRAGPASAGPADPRPIKAMVLNLNLGNRRGPELDRLLEDEAPDLLLLLEVTPRWRAGLASLEAEFPHRIEAVRDDAFGLWFLSRHPLADARLAAPDGGVPSVAAMVDMSGRRLAFLGTHPVPPTGREPAARRNAQLAWCADWADEASARADGVLVMGDLNCSPFSPHFRSLLRDGGLRDSALGRGLRPTWFSGLPGLASPIDHALVGGGLEVAARRVGPPVGSDHRAVIVEFVIPER